MTVKELIAKLQEFDENMTVRYENEYTWPTEVETLNTEVDMYGKECVVVGY